MQDQIVNVYVTPSAVARQMLTLYCFHWEAGYADEVEIADYH